MSAPSARRHVPYVLACLRTKATGSPVSPAERGDHRDAAHLKAGQYFRGLRYERGHRPGDGVKEHGVALEAVLVEVLRGSTAGAEDEVTREVRSRMDLPSNS